MLVVSRVMVGLSSNLAQLFYNEPSLIIAGCFSTPLYCSCLIFSMKKFHRHFSCCHSLAPLVLTCSLSFDTYYSNYWLWVITTTITLTSTLLVLGGLSVIVALELTSLVLNILCTSIFLGHYLGLCSMLEQIIGIMNMYFSWFNELGFCPCYRYYRFNFGSWHN